VIAAIIRLGYGLSVLIPEGAAAELRALTIARESHIGSTVIGVIKFINFI
jgi:hypothetical protein